MAKIEVFEGFQWVDQGDGGEYVSTGWYWHLRAANGKIMADGSESYVSKANARRAAIKAANHMETAEIVYR